MLSWRSCWQGGDGVRNRPTRGCLSLPRSQLGCTALYSLPFLPPLILVCPQQFEQFEQFELLLPSLPCRVLHPMPVVMVQPGQALQEFFSPPSFSTQYCSLCLFRPQVLVGEQLIWSSEGWQRAKAATILHPLHFLRANRPPTPIPTIPVIPTRPHVQMSKIHFLFFTHLPLEWWHHTYRYLRFRQYSKEVFFKSAEFWPSACFWSSLLGAR